MRPPRVERADPDLARPRGRRRGPTVACGRQGGAVYAIYHETLAAALRGLACDRIGAPAVHRRIARALRPYAVPRYAGDRHRREHRRRTSGPGMITVSR